jgi:hypothetical protein
MGPDSPRLIGRNFGRDVVLELVTLQDRCLRPATYDVYGCVPKSPRRSTSPGIAASSLM